MVLSLCKSDQLPPSPADSCPSLLARLKKGEFSGMATGADAEGKAPRAGTWGTGGGRGEKGCRKGVKGERGRKGVRG
jgi:hypothetical protein